MAIKEAVETAQRVRLEIILAVFGIPVTIVSFISTFPHPGNQYTLETKFPPEWSFFVIGILLIVAAIIMWFIESQTSASARSSSMENHIGDPEIIEQADVEKRNDPDEITDSKISPVNTVNQTTNIGGVEYGSVRDYETQQWGSAIQKELPATRFRALNDPKYAEDGKAPNVAKWYKDLSRTQKRCVRFIYNDVPGREISVDDLYTGLKNKYKEESEPIIESSAELIFRIKVLSLKGMIQTQAVGEKRTIIVKDDFFIGVADEHELFKT